MNFKEVECYVLAREFQRDKNYCKYNGYKKIMFVMNGTDNIKSQIELQLKEHLFMTECNDEKSLQLNITCIYYISKKQQQILDEILFAYENHINHFNIVIDRICFDNINNDKSINNEIIFTLNSKLNSYIIDTSSFISPFDGMCKLCKKQIPYPLYKCNICHFGAYCSNKCSITDKDHILFQELFAKFKATSPFNSIILSLKTIPLNNLVSSNIVNPGLTGLINLGNTCYFNSALQCLSHTEDLTKYFLMNYHHKEINYLSMFGSNGKIVIAFSHIISLLWKSKLNVIDPSYFIKEFLLKFPQFKITEQHDAHEMLNLLLDTLHEDLNRIQNKKYLALTEKNQNESDLSASQRWWNNHLSRENSIIVDLFHGQYKSIIECPHCGNKSITFEPFMFLSLSIPQNQYKYKIKIFSYENTQNKLKYKEYFIGIFPHSTVRNLKDKISAKELPSKFEFEVMLLSKEKIILKMLNDSEKVFPYLEKGEEICFFTKTSRDCFNVYIYPILNHNNNNITFVSYPIPISVTIKLTLLDLFYKIEKIFPNIKLYIYHNANVTSSFTSFISTFILKYNCEFCNNNFFSKPFCGIFDNTLKQTDTIQTIITQMRNNRTNIFLVESPNIERYTEIYEGMNRTLSSYINKNESLIHLSNTITIDDMLESFQCKEKLEGNNTWFCKQCKQRQLPSTMVNIYKPPKYLIIHFKRFKTNDKLKYAEKNSIAVNFHVDNFDMRKYVVGPYKEKAVYDLYGIIQHFGNDMNSGHYISKCRYFNEWYEFNDSKVNKVEYLINSQAYLLFYKMK